LRRRDFLPGLRRDADCCPEVDAAVIADLWKSLEANIAAPKYITGLTDYDFATVQKRVGEGDWQSPAGRWGMCYYTLYPDHVANRETGKPFVFDAHAPSAHMPERT